ncbi:helix-turn-helix domain-containing protein, partial [Pseudaminobacter soli (ex Li et al. 2025)]
MTAKASIGVVFATNLRELRRARGLTQIELARLSGLSLRYIGILER